MDERPTPIRISSAPRWSSGRQRRLGSTSSSVVGLACQQVSELMEVGQLDVGGQAFQTGSNGSGCAAGCQSHFGILYDQALSRWYAEKVSGMSIPLRVRFAARDVFDGHQDPGLDAGRSQPYLGQPVVRAGHDRPRQPPGQRAR